MPLYKVDYKRYVKIVRPLPGEPELIQKALIHNDIKAYLFVMTLVFQIKQAFFADGVNAGKSNTTIIIANQGNGDGFKYAARICNEYTFNAGDLILSDWYLPSKYELYLLYLQKQVIGGLLDANYWSSTEYNCILAWALSFCSGIQTSGSKSNTFYVRAVRGFCIK